jgi:hypothetical protein
MSTEQTSKTRKPGFGKRGREKVERAERKPTSMERLKKMGRRWWGASGLQMRKDPRAKGFKRSRLAR